jgi:hypothetical protein
MPEVQETARAVSSKIVLCRLFRTVAPDTFTAVFELRQIVLGDSFPHYVHAGFWAECRMVDRLLLQLVTSPIVLIVSSFSLFAIIVKRARDQQQKNARMERERLKRRI